jgi:L-arabinose isomerase
MKPLTQFEVWFVTGSVDLYGDLALQRVAEQAAQVAEALDLASEVPLRIIPKPVVKNPESIRNICMGANAAEDCVGVIAWMHTFSPAKMWIAGLSALQKPLLHLHTQFNCELPWSDIDMDFMNLNQSAHGDREFGFMEMRMGLARKTVVGHWTEPSVRESIGAWARAACGWREAQRLKVARFGDNMRNVAVTEGDKVEAQMRLGFSVTGYGVSELAAVIEEVPNDTVDDLLKDYEQLYELAPPLRPGGQRRQSLREAARIEGGLRSFLDAGGFRAFTDTFEDLDGLSQLPGLAVQRLMADGYGFAGEGDWKTAALVRIMKLMSTGLVGGTSFMEDYTYDLTPGAQKVLGAHMLEICPSIAAGKPSCEIHPLSIGGKADPVRLVCTAASGPGVVVSLIDIGERFRMVANEIEVVPPDSELPKLPVARAVWEPKPDLRTAAVAWLLAGGAHHTVFTQALRMEHLTDLAEIAQIELLVIDEATSVADFKKELRWNQAYYRLARGF